MKKILLMIAATAALAAAMPAAAQPSRGDRSEQARRGDDRGGRYNPNEFARDRWDQGTRREWQQARRIDAREAALFTKVDTAARRGRLSAGEARNFLFKLRNIEQIERGYKRHNRDLSRVEVRNLNYRLDLLDREIRQKIRS